MFGGGVSDFILGLGIDSANFGSGLSEATSDVDKFGQHAEAAGQSGGGLGGAMDIIGKGAMVAGAGVLAFGGFLVGAAKAANEEQVGMDRLYTSLGNNAKGWDGNTSAIEDYVNQAEKSAFADDKIRDSLGALVARTHDITGAQKLQAEAMDLARGKGIDLATATDVIGKVYGGNVGILARYGIAVDKNATSTEALAAIQTTYAGQADKYANSAAGSMDRLQVSMGDTLETIGHTVLNLVAGPLAGLSDWFSSPGFQAGVQAVADFIGNGLTNAFNFVSSAVQAAMPYIQPFVTAIGDFISTISSGGDIGAAAGKMFGGLGAAVANAWPVVSGALGSLIGNIVGWIGANAGSIAGTLAGWALAFGKWVWDAIPGLLSGLGSLIGTVWNWIVAAAPGIATQLAVWGMQLWKWIVDVTPTVMSNLGTFISNIWNWITTNGPGILTQLGQWVGAFLGWIGPMIPPLLGQLGGMLLSLGGWIIGTALPAIVGQLAQWVGAFLGWVLPMVPPLLGNLLSMLGSITGWLLGTGLPALLGQLAQWVGAFLGWVLPLIPPLLGNLLSMLGSITGWLLGTALPALVSKLVEWAGAFLGWIIPMVPKLLENLGTFIGNVWTWISGIAKSIVDRTLEIGGGLIDGIRQGINNAWSGLINWLQGMIKDALPQFIKDWLGIKSPSTMFAAIGEQLPAGMRVGWQTAFPGLMAAVNTNLGEMVNATRDRVSEILGMMDRVSKYGSATGGPGSGNNDYQPGTGGGGKGTGKGYATGGYMQPGEIGTVGENGPELFLAGIGGTVIPHDRGFSLGGRLGSIGRGGHGDDITHHVELSLPKQITLMVDGVPVEARVVSEDLGMRQRVTLSRS